MSKKISRRQAMGSSGLFVTVALAAAGSEIETAEGAIVFGFGWGWN
jgi:hypothetical protein